jgi:hypothetical protein
MRYVDERDQKYPEFVIDYEAKGSYLSFTAYRVSQWDVDGGRYYPDDDVFIDGDVKWDGCANFNVGDQSVCMEHTCRRKHMELYSLVLLKAHDLAAENIKGWDGDD